MKKIAAVALILACGCAGHEVSKPQQTADKLKLIRDEVSRVVHDEERRKKIQSAIDRCEFELKVFNRIGSAFQNYLHVLNADPSAPRIRFDEVIARYEAQRKERRAHLMKIHHELLALTTDEEWRAIAKREAELYQIEDPSRPEEGK